MTATVPPEGIRTVSDAVERMAAERGDETFLRHRDRTMSYAELDRTANAIADEFRAQGVGPGDHVGLFLYNSPEYVCTFFALAKLGAVATPIDTRFTGDTLAYVLSTSDIEIVLVDDQTRADYESVRSRVPGLGAEYFVSDPPVDSPYRDFESLLGGRTSPPEVSVEESDTVSLTYVQQHSTNQPRGVLMPQFSYVNTGWESCRTLFDYDEDDRIFTTLPLYSIFTFQLGVMGTLLAGGEFIIEDGFVPERFWDQIDRYDATVFLYLSRMLSVLYNQDIEPEGGETPAEVAVGASPGFASDEGLFRAFEDRFDITLLEGYGTTAVSTIAAYNSIDDRNLASVGKPPSYAELEIVDEDDWPVPTGEPGEIVVRPTRPNAMMTGYYGNPERTIEDCRNQWIHTGGIGYRDEDGYVHFVATKENSIYRGRIAGRISSLEIESVINALPGVETSAVVGVVNEGGGEEVKAVVVPEDGVDITPVDVCKRCEQQLPYLKVPRYIEIRSELPRTPSGKVSKEALREEATSGVWDRNSGYDLSR
ncbi:class I adenylate-forming enzyme family protein [Haloglomus litoreum]|uniref:class I adenylate-forming enzyme family protein n=1 Tax=Haloglomus litoreum TaxID=3034026 RepID=UPI0023E89D83|nr:AMP-binding protein [Haloglomus sp. DT116]